MFKSLHLFAVAVAVCIIPASSLVCDGQNEITTASCTSLLNNIERALLQDESNLSRMRRAFFHSPTASPVLIKVVYNLTFAENITFATATNEIPYCSSSTENSTIDFMQQNTTYGWTSSGVYTAFHPIVLNMMQAHTPFAILRIIHVTLNQRGPEADTFLWDGSYNLPTLHLNIHIISLSCVPSKDLFYSVLKDFNTLLKVYAGRQEKLKFIQDQAAIGFTLPSTSVSTNIDPHRSDVTMAILYSSVFCFLYLLSVCLLLFWYFHQRGRRYREQQIRKVFESNIELIGGMLMTAIIAIAFEFCTRIANSIVWTVHRENSLGNFLAVWLPQLFLFFFATLTNTGGHIYICIKKWQEFNDQSFFDRIFHMCKSKVHAILPLQLTLFGLLYCFFPAIILIFVYPTRMIAIFTFVPAYLFATTVVFAILIKFFRLFKKDKRNPNVQVDRGGAPGENKEEAPGENEGGAPGENKEEAPGENEGGAPGENKEEAPGENEGGAPGENEGGAPEENKEEAPGENEGGAPGENEEEAPGENEGGVPGENEEEAPGENEGGAPGENEGGAPGENERAPGENEGGVPGENEGNEKRIKILKFLVALVPTCLLLFFVYIIILNFLYSVIIGNGSAVNTGPLFIVSLIPSVFIMLGAWIANRIVLNGSRNFCTCTNTDSST